MLLQKITQNDINIHDYIGIFCCSYKLTKTIYTLENIKNIRIRKQIRNLENRHRIKLELEALENKCICLSIYDFLSL